MPNTVNTVVPDIYKGNDWFTVVELFKSILGKKVGLTDADGAATGFLNVDPTATTPADPALALVLTYIPDEPDAEVPAGRWEVKLQTSGAADTALDPYKGLNLYAIARHPGGARAVAKVKVNETRYFAVK